MNQIYRHLAPWLLTITEAIMVLAAIFVSLRSRRRETSLFFDRVEKLFGQLARRPALAVGFTFVIALSIRAILIPLLGIPLPDWNDEYSHLLAANTFAAGRLTNPTHPMWIHFESFQIIQRPTYMSMYAPGQALIMAAGIVLGGHPWIGIWVVTALMCATLCWMLQAWFPPTWALFGAMLAVLRFATFSYWMNSYWCPALAATGGALVLGAIPRLRRRPRVPEGILLALGLAMMANSRPYEGLVFSIAVAAGLFLWLKGRSLPPWRRVFCRMFLPAACVLIVAAAATGYYYWRVTGSPFRMTYAVDRETYAVAPYFLFFSKRAVPEYHHAVMRDYYAGWEVRQFDEGRTFIGFLRRTFDKIVQLWRFYIGPAFVLPLLAFPWIVRDRRMRLALVAGFIFCLGWLVETWTFPHYVAPALGLVYLVLVQGMRHLRRWRRNGAPVGQFLVRSVPVVCVGMVVLRLAGIVAHAPLEPHWPLGNMDRVRIVERLNAIPGAHLVIVRYGPEHNVDRDWIYNAPDIDRASIVWARDMSKDQNLELLRYFHDRRAWLMSGDESPPLLEPYPVN
ncbi:MAG TPA: hypothetical protein VH350_11695 [Candidatus Sulfotelmatobacter sp.]|jgi:hypothetical protein|nr:hypothetical protein [Candidatus Sulfotelmatobacter sp.]